MTAKVLTANTYIADFSVVLTEALLCQSKHENTPCAESIRTAAGSQLFFQEETHSSRIYICFHSEIVVIHVIQSFNVHYENLIETQILGSALKAFFSRKNC